MPEPGQSKTQTSARTMWRNLRFLYRRQIIWWFGYDFFISYCHESESYCKSLYDSLSGDYVCFLDRAPEGILAGERLGDSISMALRRSRIFVLIWSPAVATNEWPRAESRFFSANSPDRRLVLICPSPYGNEIPEIVFASELSMLQPELERWLRNAKTESRASFVPDSVPRAIVEENCADLRGQIPSEKTIIQLRESHAGTTVPRKARRILFSVTTAMAVLAMGVWMFYAAESASHIVATLQESPYDREKISEATDSSVGYSLKVTLHEGQLQAAARRHRHSDLNEWHRICRLLDDYHFYHRWSSLGWGHHGISLDVSGVPNVVAVPQSKLPRGIVELRLSADRLPRDWLEQLRTVKDLQKLQISARTLETPELLAKALNSLHVTDLRIASCNSIQRSLFLMLDKATLQRLKRLRLSSLPELHIRSSLEQNEFASVLLQCDNLEELALDQLPNCRFGQEFFRNLVQNHRTLCKRGLIEVDPISLPADVSSFAAEKIPDCNCQFRLIEFDDIL